MEKEFVPYELAVKLKQIGFNELCLSCYNKLGMIASHGQYVFDYKNYNSSVSMVSRPTFSQAFRWFREKYLYNPHFFSKEDGTFVWCIRWYVDGLQKDTPYSSSNTYEESEFACLEKLIEIVETRTK